MHRSEQIQEIAKALAEVQGKLNPASKNAQNPHLKNRYADMAAVWDTLRGILPLHGLSVVQTMVPRDDGRACVRTTLMHSSGQWIEGECALPVPKQDPQGYGSAITYARRYSLSAMVGVVSEEDDDGNAATSKGNNNRQRNMGKTVDQPPTGLMTDSQRKRIMALYGELGMEREERMSHVNDWLTRGGRPQVASTSELPANIAQKLITALEKKLSEIQMRDPFGSAGSAGEQQYAQ